MCVCVCVLETSVNSFYFLIQQRVKPSIGTAPVFILYEMVLFRISKSVECIEKKKRIFADTLARFNSSALTF